MRRKPVFPFFVILVLGTAVISLVRADYKTQEITTRNPVINCSTNPKYENKYIASAFRAGGAHTGARGQKCNACHKSSRPVAGRGDKPVTKTATALVHNRYRTSVSYEIKVGTEKWEKYSLQAGGVRRHSWDYKRANQNASPAFRIRYEHPREGRREVPLHLIATPNPDLGSVYFFEPDSKTGKPILFVPSRQPDRAH